MEYEIKLTDLIETKTLQQIQEAFSNMTGIASMTTDANGTALIEGTMLSEFCMKYMKFSSVGCSRCEQCNKQGAEMALREGKSIAYTCHAGLIDFAAPIVVNDELIGCFIGGQVLLEEPDLEKMSKYADEMGIDSDEYIAALKEIKVVTREEIERASEFLYSLGGILSDITYSRHLLFQANLELGQSVNMKSDFLANMSHEIRTPMNAVIGMAEMALREELPTIARDYINQIKVAGKSLLAIINDILDFSKIESGKMDIFPDEYEPISVVHDVANIIMTRLDGKDVELILDISPDLPYKLVGDSIRIKQIILNLANNAAKFTNDGQIVLKLEAKSLVDEVVELYISVEDTGIGIKQQDLGKLFQSFSQVDSKRNRNIEGTGLGLAISKQLLTLMDGEIWVESEYEKGSKFSFRLPQKVCDPTPSIKVKEAESILAAGLICNPYVAKHLETDAKALGVDYRVMHSGVELFTLPKDKRLFCFFEQSMFTLPMEEFIKNNPDITAILLIDFRSNIQYDIPNLLVVKKPIFVLNMAMIFNQQELHLEYEDTSEKDFEFIAPEAEILIVDDNAVNLTVAEGLLEPLKMKIDTALSGKEAIGKISVHHYDIVFMDHMMPEVDGVETTHIIRRFHKEYDDVPIIALTANAVDGTREMFCREGMNDFVAKPIELRLLISKVKQWLPPEKIQRVYGKQNVPEHQEENKEIVIGDLDVAYALQILGNEKLFWSVVKEYYRVIEKKVELIKTLETDEDWTGYTIEVHALKSASKQIGAISLSEKAAAMEMAGNARNTKLIHEKTDEMLEQYLGYVEVLKPYCCEEEESEEEKSRIPDDILRECLEDMKSAAEELDMDLMEDVIEELGEYKYEGWEEELFGRLKEAVNEVDVDSCEEILHEWENRWSQNIEN